MSQGVHLRKYGVEAKVNFELYDLDGVDMNTGAASASGDINIMRDEAAEEQLDADAFVDEGTGYSLVLSAAEMNAARVIVYIIDQTGPKDWLDKAIIVETYGNALAQHAFDLDTASVAQSADNETRLATIEADTNELQGDDYPTSIAAVQTVVDALDTLTKAAGDGDLAAILVDTAELGAAVGASLSADIAAIKAETALILTDTAVIGALGAGLTAVPWNAAWDAEVQSECTDALNAYDPPTKTEMDTAHGLLATVAKQDVIDALIDAIKVVTDNMAAAATTMITGIVSWDNTNATTTVVYSSDIIEATADHFNGRLFVPTSGALLGQYTYITDYALDTGEGKFTVTALTEPPADNTTFVIL